MQVRPFSHKFNNKVTKELQRLKFNGNLAFTNSLTVCPDIGTIVKHDGDGTRRHWIGIIEKFTGLQSDYLTVRWLVCNNGNSLMDNRYRQRCTSGGVLQDYSKEWARMHLLSGKLSNHNIFELLNTNEEGNKTMKNYLVWSPTGNTNPSVRHGSEKEAVKVAEEMAAKYGGEFFVAKLVSKSVRNNVVTTKL